MAYTPPASELPQNHLDIEIENQPSPNYRHAASAIEASSSAVASTSNNSSYYHFDVFINHRGPDVKKTLASHLHRRLKSNGLRVFLDCQELQEGEKLTCQIQGAIRTASVHVAIFSPKYAESSWCLDELVQMLESGAPIIPVFYHVRPGHLRWTQGVYAQALHELEMKKTYDSETKEEKLRYDSTTIHSWRNALSSVAQIIGLDLEAFNGDEGELLDKVVECVLKKSKRTQLNVAEYPTGLDEKVKDFETTVLSQQQSGKVQVVGIAGLGGVGKTTLAKELFNRKISNYSNALFLSEVREKVAKSSLNSLQSKLLKDLTQLNLHIDNSHHGIEMISKHFPSSQVLLVLDDVDQVDQVNALLPSKVVKDVLHPDSLVLITSRDKNVLTRSGVQDSSIYMLTGLDLQHSRELLCSHAFLQPHPPPGFEYLVDEFVRACNQLPLSLKVFGGLLYGNNVKSYWKAQLDRLQTLPSEIQKRLQISYDALHREEQQIFLDIVCFFIGKNLDRVSKSAGQKSCGGGQS